MIAEALDMALVTAMLLPELAMAVATLLLEVTIVDTTEAVSVGATTVAL